MKNEELWRSIEGYAGLYEISNFGRVKSLRSSGKGRRARSDGILNLNDANRDYLRITLSKGSMRYRTHLVHRLVVTAFIGEIPSGYDVNHKDCNKKNNNVANLEVVTKRRNSNHAVENGLLKVIGEDNPCAKLTDEQVIDIRRRLANGERNIRLAECYGVSGSLINMIKRRAIWRHIP